MIELDFWSSARRLVKVMGERSVVVSYDHRCSLDELLLLTVLTVQNPNDFEPNGERERDREMYAGDHISGLARHSPLFGTVARNLLTHLTFSRWTSGTDHGCVRGSMFSTLCRASTKIIIPHQSPYECSTFDCRTSIKFHSVNPIIISQRVFCTLYTSR